MPVPSQPASNSDRSFVLTRQSVWDPRGGWSSPAVRRLVEGIPRQGPDLKRDLTPHSDGRVHLWRDCIVSARLRYQRMGDMQMYGFAQLSERGGPVVFTWCSRSGEFCVTSPEPSPEVNPVVMRIGVLGLDGFEKCNGSIWHSHKRIPRRSSTTYVKSEV
jgi:hypothetical protein